MSHIKKIRQDSATASELAHAYGRRLGELMANLDPKEVDAFAAELDRARKEKRRVFIAGNGGSAATASHMGVDLGGAVFRQGATQRPFHVQPLTDHTAMITASGNDYGYQHIFTRQLEMYFQEGDVLVVISASGNSPNVVEAATWAREHKGTVLGLLGFDGGKLAALCDVSVIVKTPNDEYGPVEDVHAALNHVLTLWMHLDFAKDQ